MPARRCDEDARREGTGQQKQGIATALADASTDLTSRRDIAKCAQVLVKDLDQWISIVLGPSG